MCCVARSSIGSRRVTTRSSLEVNALTSKRHVAFGGERGARAVERFTQGHSFMKAQRFNVVLIQQRAALRFIRSFVRSFIQPA